MDAHPQSLRSKQRQMVRHEIVRTAFELFARHGYEKVSAEMIARAAGLSRATFFNYFPQKELILREVAAARMERLRALFGEFALSGRRPTFAAVEELLLKMADENARITRGAKKLALETFFYQASQGLLLAAREQAVKALAAAVGRVPRRRHTSTALIAETLFALFLAAMLEWLMREGVPENWLRNTIRRRLRLVWKGVS
ncbi:MAG: TetR family transcriptional regulator [Deltaproteobacteria bacterium]